MALGEFLDEIQKLVVASQQEDLFGNKETLVKESIEVCAKFLKGQNYSVRPPLSYPAKITKLDDLVAMFYVFLNNFFN